MERTTIFIPPELRRRLVDEARGRRQPQAAVVREALERYFSERPARRPTIVGAVEVEGVDARAAKAWVRRRWKDQGTEA